MIPNFLSSIRPHDTRRAALLDLQRTPSSPRLWRWHFLLALAVLALNDHLLKGSGVLPGWLTGKLSDFAGLYVAPAVLAVVLQVRSRSSLNLCALAIGVVFTALQVSHQAVEVWETASALLGVPWLVTMDPTDLIALPMAAASAHVFAEPTSTRPRLRERLVLVTALVACAASSPPDDDWGSRQTTAPIIVNTSTKREATVRLQTLRTDLTYDCERLLEQPRESFPRAAFGLAQRFVLQPGEHFFIDDLGQAPCLVLLAAIDGRAPMLLAWEADEFPERLIPRQLNGEQLRDVATDTQFVTIDFDGENPSELVDTSANLLLPFTPRYDVVNRCEVAAEAPEQWTTFPLYGKPLLIESRRYGLDGCFELELSAHPVDAANANAPVVPGNAPFDPVPVVVDDSTEVNEDTVTVSDAGAPTIDADAGATTANAADAITAPLDADAGVPPEPNATDAGLAGENKESDGGRFDGGGSDVEQVATSELAGLDTVRLRLGEPVSSTTWLCIPEDAFMFENGELITVQPGTDSVTISGQGGSLTVFRDGTVPRQSFPIEIEASATDDCPFSVSEFPAVTHRPTAVTFVTPWGRATLMPGQSEWLRSDTFVAMVGVSHSSERILGPGLSNTVSGFYAVMEMGK